MTVKKVRRKEDVKLFLTEVELWLRTYRGRWVVWLLLTKVEESFKLDRGRREVLLFLTKVEEMSMKTLGLKGE